MMNKLSLFLGLLCFFGVSKSGFCTESDSDNSNGRAGARFITVTSFGAVGDAKSDDSRAFLRAWEAVCKGGRGQATLVVPRGKVFMLKPLTFFGPCKTPTIRGHLVAPGYTWDVRRNGAWISFDNVVGLVVTGGGTINGRGSLWWGRIRDRPSAMHFHKCDGLRLFQLRHINSPRNHIGIDGSKNVDISRLKITAPDNSPNTDGINVSNCGGVNIHDSFIGTGDDCVALNAGSAFVNITRIFCGPGHGISIGSLGANGAYATVEEVRVRNCTLTNTQNGVRIKTYQGSSGYARKISFENIHVVASRNPIIIDQYYTNAGYNGVNKGGIQVSNIRYQRVFGTSANDEAITFKCNKNLGCTNIVMNRVEMTSATPGHKIYSVCENAHGISSFVQPQSCLRA